MRVLVCGGRGYRDRETVAKVLCGFHSRRPISVLIQGGATGADDLARLWAKRLGIEVLEFAADWASHGRSAGPIRNARMLAEGRPVLVIAFHGGSGTQNMIDQARKAGVEVVDVEFEEMIS